MWISVLAWNLQLFPLLEITSFLKLTNTFLYPKLRLRNVTDPGIEQLIQIKYKRKDKGVKTDNCRVTRYIAFNPKYSLRLERSYNLMAAHWSCSLLSILKYLLIPYCVPVLNISSCSLFSQEDLLGALFSIIQHVSIRIIPCICRAPNFVKYFPIYDHDFQPHMVIANFRRRNVKIPSALTCTDADPS